MKKRITYYLFTTVACFLVTTNSFSQQAKPIYFKFGKHIPTKLIVETENLTSDYSEKELVNGYYFRLIQFEKIPNQEQKEALFFAGINLLEYIPDNSFFAAISSNANLSALTKNNATSIEKIETNFKLSEALFHEDYPNWALVDENKIELNAIYFSTIEKQKAEDALNSVGAIILNSNDAHTIRFVIEISRLEDVYSLSHFYYFETSDQPGEPENFRGRTSHRSNTIATDFLGGLKYDGTGMTVMLQDDGIIGPHIDYEGRINQRTSSNNGNHGDHTAGTLMGAGNLDPKGRGAAFGAFLLVYGSSNNNYDNVPTLYTTEDVFITSKSYSNGCNVGYTSLARQLDQQTRMYPSLIHVFSAGNDGTSDCGYGAGNEWGNITGGHKSGKNVVAVGNLSYTDALASSSSRGPATDGRIKPDVCAVGTSVFSTMDPNTYQTISGTSMACPGVAGVFTQLYHAYKDLNGGAIPNSALMKAIVLNTADDIGNIGPDYKHGWGRINARRAFDVMNNYYYTSGSINQGDVNTHVITVPANTAQVKIMVYWTDYEGVANASKALVNDINMQIVDPSTNTFNPWVLNPTPDPTSLNSLAVRGNDTLNNMEQVTIDNPTVGDYTINIDGFAIPQGPQEYFIVYEFITDDVTVTYPIGGEGFSPGTPEVVRWDAFGNISPFSIEYSTDNGSSWMPINTNYNQNLRYINWNVPNELTGLAKIKITRSGKSDESDEVFSIIETPSGLKVDWVCDDSLQLSWNSISGATSYEVYKLGAVYMEPIATSTTNSIVLYLSGADTFWFSVRAMGPDNALSERAVAIQKLPGTFSCVLPTDAGISTALPSNNTIILDCITPSISAVAHVSNDGFEILTNISVNYQLNGGGVVTEVYAGPLSPGDTYVHTFTTPLNPISGNNTLVVWSDKTGDNNKLNDTVRSGFILNDTPPRTLPWSLDFESFSLCSTASNCESGVCILSDDLINIPNTEDDIDWRTDSGGTPSSGTGPSQDFNPGNSTGKYLYLEPSANPICTNKTALLITPCIDLTSTTDPYFIFAYHMYGADMGSIAIDAFVNNVWINDITTPISGNQGDSWLIKDVSLSAYVGEIINLRIRGTTGNNYASDMAIDDIRLLEGFVGIEDNNLSRIAIFPNPFKDEISISGLNNNFHSEIIIYNIIGEIIYKKVEKDSAVTIDVSSLSNGLYMVEIKNNDVSTFKKLFKE